MSIFQHSFGIVVMTGVFPDSSVSNKSTCNAGDPGQEMEDNGKRDPRLSPAGK